ncbi:MAG TPA: asparagine synthase (glutamine-hydrolyzing) [Gemmatimonadaceae bacterium]|nr:asparagine synthase (glutamine-hydrolyzing) [Gemmatimonadaceae bacterium]
MCGIVGMVGPRAQAHRDRIVAARELMHHRGPDDAGVWEAPGAVLAARRLSIVDLTPAGHQPMVSADGRCAIVFNGEIYNHRELRRELERDVRFVSHADTEVVLHGYRRWGLRGLVDRLDGMFAFAVWDGDRRELAAARDRAGKKPLFYRHTGHEFAFASVANALMHLHDGPLEVEPHAVDAFLVYQAVPAPLGIFRGMRQLAPAHILRFEADTGACRVERYWHLSYRDKVRQPVREIVDEVERLARNAVRKRLVADVPVGMFLSGGVDSSLVASLAAQESETPLEAVTLGFDEAEFDERPYARTVADRAGLRLHEELLRPALVADLPGIVWHYGQPVADVSIVPNYYLAAAASRRMKVVLNGDGGDELFGGYRRPLIEYLVGPYRERVPEHLRRAVGAALEAHQDGRLSRAAALARAGAMPAADAFTYDRAFRLFRSAEFSRQLLGAVDDWHPDRLYREEWNRADGPTDIDRALSGDFHTYFPDQLLTKADRSSMAHGVEARSPLVDTALMEYAARIPAAMHFHHLRTKSLLKRVAARFVPPEVVYRRKRGFVMPASAWLRGELADYARAALDNRTFFDRGWLAPRFVRRMLEEHFTGLRDWGEQLFTLLVLEVWARITLDRTLDRTARMDAFLSTPIRGPRRRIRTLQVGLEWFAERPGGLNRMYYELVRHLPDAGVAVHGLVAGTDAVERESDGLVEGFLPHGESLLARIPSLYRRGRAAVLGDPKRLVVSHFALYTYPLLHALGARPLVVHFQGPWGLEGAAERQNPLVVAAKTAVERAVYRRATAFIVLSTPFGRILEQRFGVRADRIHVVPGGVDVSRFAITATRDECRAMLGWPRDRTIVLAVRRLARRMGLDDLVASVARLRERVPDVLVLIAGRGAIAADLAREIARLGLAEHVRLVGFIPDERLPHAYRAADVSVVPSVTLEGFGLIVAESFAAGTPAIVTPVGGLPEAVGDLSPHLVLAGTGPDALAAGLADALSGRIALPSAADCHAFARERYDWPVIARRVAAVYEAALG